MLASGRPAVAAVDLGGSVAEVLRASGAGVAVQTLDVSTFAEALRAMADDPGARAEAGRRGREYAEREWSRDAVLAKFYDRAVQLSVEATDS
jgi:colanic acid biosynthesis glycosyl transferase WcaI